MTCRSVLCPTLLCALCIQNGAFAEGEHEGHYLFVFPTLLCICLFVLLALAIAFSATANFKRHGCTLLSPLVANGLWIAGLRVGEGDVRMSFAHLLFFFPVFLAEYAVRPLASETVWLLVLFGGIPVQYLLLGAVLDILIRKENPHLKARASFYAGLSILVLIGAFLLLVLIDYRLPWDLRISPGQLLAIISTYGFLGALLVVLSTRWRGKSRVPEKERSEGNGGDSA